MSQHSCAPTVTPRPRQLRDPLLRVLHRLTSKPNVFVETAQVIDDVIREAGFDPDNLPLWAQDPKSISNGGQGAGINRNITLAFRYAYRDHNPALTVRGPAKGQWGLTEAGVAHAITMRTPVVPVVVPVVVVPLPRSRTLYLPMLRALGKLSGHTLTMMPRLDIMRATLTDAGYDPDALPLGWGDAASNGQLKIHETLRWVARSMSTLIMSPCRGQWALTVLGLERAAKLNGVTLLAPAKVPPVQKSTGPNITSKWFSKHLALRKGQADSDLMSMMKGALRKHLPLSAKRDMIDDHIQNFMVRVIRRDSFANMLAAGNEIPYSKVASYCVNSGRSDARDMGTDPVCREMLGARTNRERQMGVVMPDTTTTTRGGEKVFLSMLETLSTDQNLSIDFEDIWERIVSIVQERKPGAWERYANLLLMKASGFTVQEIAAKEGVGRHRAARMLATVRQIVRESGESFAAFC